MINKIKFNNLIPPTLAVLVTVILVIACGKGELRDIDDDELKREIEKADSSLVKKISSFSMGGGSASSKYTVKCTVVIDTGSVDTAIPSGNRPKVECVETANPANVLKVLDSREDVQWFDAPVWAFPEVGDYPSIKVEVYKGIGACEGLTATCSGTFRVCPQTGCPSSSSMASSSSVIIDIGSSGTDIGTSSSSVGVSSSSVASSSSAKVTILCQLPETLTAGATISVETQRSYLKCSNTEKSPDTGIPMWVVIEAPIATIIDDNKVTTELGEYPEIVVFASCGAGVLSSINGNCNKVSIVAPASSSSATTGTSSATTVTSSSSVATVVSSSSRASSSSVRSSSSVASSSSRASSSSVRSSSSVASSSSRASSSSAVSSSSMTCPTFEANKFNCLWNEGGDCWSISDQVTLKSCGEDAWVFQGGSTGNGALCKTGTFVCGKTNTPPTEAKDIVGCCKWANQGGKCYDVYSTEEKNNCKDSNKLSTATSCPDKNGGCPDDLK